MIATTVWKKLLHYYGMIVFQRPLVRLAMLIIFPFQQGEEYIRTLTQTDYEDGDTVMF